MKGATVVAGEMTIAEGHLLLCFAGLGKQPLRGITTTNDCANRRQRPVLSAAVVSIATNYVANQRGNLSPSRMHFTPPSYSQVWDTGSSWDHAILQHARQGWDKWDKICPSMVHVPSLWLSLDSHRRGTEVLTWASIIHSSTTTRLTLAKSY